MKIAKDITTPISSPLVVITSPRDESTVSSSTINVFGNLIDGGFTGVMVNGIAATISGGKFTATGIPLAGYMYKESLSR